MNTNIIFLPDTDQIVLTEGAVVERILRSDPEMLDPELAHARAIYSERGRRLLAGIHRQYLDIGRRYDLPLLVFTDTWRASADRLRRAGMAGWDMNGDCARFLRGIVQEYGEYAGKVVLAGLIGCKGDAYKPEEALSMREAASFHAYQVEALITAGVDLLFAATIPSVSEATGMAAAMAASGLPYAISFVLAGDGRILDGTTVRKAIETIDESTAPRPLFYMANCCHPAFFEAAMRDLQEDAALLHRIIGLQANTSTKDAGERDSLTHLDQEDPEKFAESMLGLHRTFGTRVLGGCCGTDDRHILALAEQCKQRASEARGQKELS